MITTHYIQHYSMTVTTFKHVLMLIMLFYSFVHVVPPTVNRLNSSSHFIVNKGDEVSFLFEIGRADPQVMLDGIRWFYSRNLTLSERVEITGRMGPVQGGDSMYSFSSDMLSLTITNINQALRMNESTDAGRYFIQVTNPAGNDSEYYDIIVNG